MKIAITTSTFAKYDSKPLTILDKNNIKYILNPYRRKLKKNELIEIAADCDGIIAGTEIIDKSVFDMLPELKVISRCGVGMDNVDLKTAENRGISVLRTPFGPTAAVAELVIGLMLDLVRKINLMNNELKNGLWEKRMGNLLSGKNVGIIGFGRIGQKVADLLQSFNVNIAYSDIHEVDNRYPKKSLDELLEWSNIVTLHCNASSDNTALIGKNELAKMNKESWLINTSRGGLVDENALFEAINKKEIKGAALDVFEKEPYDGPLKKLENIILTPHVGSYAKEGRIEMEIQSVNNLIEGLKKK